MPTEHAATANHAEAGAVLGVARSLAGLRWELRPADDRKALALAQRLDLPEPVGRVLAARGIGPDAADPFLTPRLRDALTDPSLLRDMDTAVERLAGAVMQGEQIAVFADYDVDGATSAALVVRFLAAVGSRARVYVPDRLTEGYGPNLPALMRLRDEGASVVITLDCGTAAQVPLAAAADAGLEVIVIDHHEAEAALPRALAVVNPNRFDETGPHRQLAAVGVAFLLVIGLNRALRQAGWYERRAEPDLMQWLDLVALGTVCDVVPLTGLNRALVAQGLAVMAARRNTGLRALADAARLDEAPGAYHAGFILGPRINAGGRVGEPDLGVRLLTTGDEAEAADLARRLDTLNRERQALEARVLSAAEARLQATGVDAPLVFAIGEDWHPGVIGIVAGRLKEHYHRPACVVALAGETGIGSGRSVSGFNVGAAIIAARQAGLLVHGGGHAMAAGFTVRRDRVDDLARFLGDRARTLDEYALTPRLMLDGTLAVAGATAALAEVLARVGPFGVGNPEPRFAIARARLVRADVVGEDHVRCILAGEDGTRLRAIAFRSRDADLGRALLHHDGAAFHLAGRLRLDAWRGRASVQFTVDDAARAW